MTILNRKEIKKINEVVEFIVKRNDERISVNEVKEKFGLSSEEYEMCMEFAMPMIRLDNKLRNGETKTSERRKKGVKDGKTERI